MKMNFGKEEKKERLKRRIVFTENKTLMEFRRRFG
jgi:hypothetical protein